MSTSGFNRVMDFVWRPENDGQPFHSTAGDPGGATAWGATYRWWSAWVVQQGHPAPSLAQFEAMSRDDFLPYYHDEVWVPIMGDRLPVGVDLVVAECAVLSGAGVAALLLRKALGLVPGHFISETIVRCIPPPRGLPSFIDRFCSLHDTYDHLAGENAFQGGWHNRVLRGRGTAMAWLRGDFI